MYVWCLVKIRGPQKCGLSGLCCKSGWGGIYRHFDTFLMVWKPMTIGIHCNQHGSNDHSCYSWKHLGFSDAINVLQPPSKSTGEHTVSNTQKNTFWGEYCFNCLQCIFLFGMFINSMRSSLIPTLDPLIGKESGLIYKSVVERIRMLMGGYLTQQTRGHSFR